MGPMSIQAYKSQKKAQEYAISGAAVAVKLAKLSTRRS